MDQLSAVDAGAIRQAIERTNFMVVNRLKASCTVKFMKTQNICREGVPYPTYNAKIVSLAPELSLSTIGETIPVIEVPRDLPCPSLKELAFLLTQIGHMIMHQAVPTHAIADLGDTTRTIPNIYKKGQAALNCCTDALRGSF